MADYIVDGTELTSVANAIRTKGGTNSPLAFPNGFVSAVNNISGGGGSSDFSTAEVTIVGGTNGIAISGGIEGTTEGYLFIKSTEYGDTGITAVGVPAGATITAKAILFKTLDPEVGHDFTAYFSPVNGAIASVDGDCEILEETSVLIWGDCTITAS